MERKTSEKESNKYIEELKTLSLKEIRQEPLMLKTDLINLEKEELDTAYEFYKDIIIANENQKFLKETILELNKIFGLNIKEIIKMVQPEIQFKVKGFKGLRENINYAQEVLSQSKPIEDLLNINILFKKLEKRNSLKNSIELYNYLIELETKINKKIICMDVSNFNFNDIFKLMYNPLCYGLSFYEQLDIRWNVFLQLIINNNKLNIFNKIKKESRECIRICFDKYINSIDTIEEIENLIKHYATYFNFLISSSIIHHNYLFELILSCLFDWWNKKANLIENESKVVEINNIIEFTKKYFKQVNDWLANVLIENPIKLNCHPSIIDMIYSNESQIKLDIGDLKQEKERMQHFNCIYQNYLIKIGKELYKIINNKLKLVNFELLDNSLGLNLELLKILIDIKSDYSLKRIDFVLEKEMDTEIKIIIKHKFKLYKKEFDVSIKKENYKKWNEFYKENYEDINLFLFFYSNFEDGFDPPVIIKYFPPLSILTNSILNLINEFLNLKIRDVNLIQEAKELIKEISESMINIEKEFEEESYLSLIRCLFFKGFVAYLKFVVCYFLYGKSNDFLLAFNNEDLFDLKNYSKPLLEFMN